MALNSLGIEVPAGGDAFDPQGDMVQLGASMAGRIVVPVVNAAAAATLLTAVGATTAQPLFIWQADLPTAHALRVAVNPAGPFIAAGGQDYAHTELSGDNTANPNVPTATGNWAITSGWGGAVTISTSNLLVAATGLHAVSALVRFGAAITGRGYAEIQVNGVKVARGIGGNGDDHADVTVPNLYLTAGQAVTIWGYQTLATAQSMFVTARITRLPGGTA